MLLWRRKRTADAVGSYANPPRHSRIIGLEGSFRAWLTTLRRVVEKVCVVATFVATLNASAPASMRDRFRVGVSNWLLIKRATKNTVWCDLKYARLFEIMAPTYTVSAKKSAGRLSCAGNS